MPTTIRNDGSTKAIPAKVAPVMPAFEITDGDGNLCRQGSRHDLGQRQGQLVSILADASALLDQIAVHEADQRHRPAEAEGAEVEKVADEFGQSHGHG